MIRRNFLTSLLGGLAALFIARPAKSAEQEYRLLMAPQLQDPDLKVTVNPEPYQGTNEIRHTDVRAMLDAIAAHTRATGDIILRCDAPRQLLFGFHALGMRGPGILWDIHMTDLKNSLREWRKHPSPKLELMERYLSSPESRDVLCRAFPGQRRSE